MEEIVLNKERNVSMRIFSTEEKDSKIGILILPGGGYGFCSERESNGIAEKFVSHHFPSIVLHYSVGKYRSLNNALEDVKSVFDYFENHPEIGIEELIIIGFSAGGHLAALYSNTLGVRKPLMNILGYPCILSSMNELLEIDGPSIDELVSENTPRTFIFATAEDELVPVENSIAYTHALTKHKVPFESHIYQYGHHGLSLGTIETANGDSKQINKQFATWFPLCIDWINYNIKEIKNGRKI